MLRKIQIAIDCADDDERDQVQKIMADLSAMRFDAKKLISAYPWFKSHQADLMKLFNLISTDGIKAIVSVNGGSLIAKLMRS